MRLLLLLVFGALVCVIAGLFTYSAYRNLDAMFDEHAVEARRTARDNLVRLGQLTAMNTAINAQASYLDNNFSYVEKTAAGLTDGDRDVAFVACLDDREDVVAQSGDLAHKEAAIRAIADEVSRAGGGASIDDAQTGLLLVGAAVRARSGERLGTVVIAYDPSETLRRIAADEARKRDENRAAVEKTALTGGLVALIGIFAAVLLGSWVARPISRLSAVAGQLGTGDFDVRAEVNGPAELRRLARTFNSMAETLKGSIEQSIAKAALEREMELARELQIRMMPPEGKVSFGKFELVSWYSPAGACGGDWLSYYPLPAEDRLLLLVGDVMGHGMPAAFVVAAVKSACEMAVASKRDLAPATLLDEIHQATLRATGGKMTMSCLATCVDFASSKLVCGAGGHPWPLVLSGASRDTTLVPVRGSLLGEDVAPSFSTVSHPIARGDLLLLFTDGLTEAANGDEKEYGHRRLLRVLRDNAERPLEDIVATLRADVEGFLGGVAPQDDITVILGRYLG